MLSIAKNLVSRSSEETLVSTLSLDDISIPGIIDSSFSPSHKKNSNTDSDVDQQLFDLAATYLAQKKEIPILQDKVSDLDESIRVFIGQKNRAVLRSQIVLDKARYAKRMATSLTSRLLCYYDCDEENKVLNALKEAVAFCEKKLKHCISYQPEIKETASRHHYTSSHFTQHLSDTESRWLLRVKDNACHIQSLKLNVLHREQRKNDIRVVMQGIEKVGHELVVLIGSLEQFAKKVLVKIDEAIMCNLSSYHLKEESLGNIVLNHERSALSSNQSFSSPVEKILAQDTRFGTNSTSTMRRTRQISFLQCQGSPSSHQVHQQRVWPSSSDSFIYLPRRTFTVMTDNRVERRTWPIVVSLVCICTYWWLGNRVYIVPVVFSAILYSLLECGLFY